MSVIDALAGFYIDTTFFFPLFLNFFQWKLTWQVIIMWVEVG